MSRRNHTTLYTPTDSNYGDASPGTIPLPSVPSVDPYAGPRNMSDVKVAPNVAGTWLRRGHGPSEVSTDWNTKEVFIPDHPLSRSPDSAANGRYEATHDPAPSTAASSQPFGGDHGYSYVSRPQDGQSGGAGSMPLPDAFHPFNPDACGPPSHNPTCWNNQTGGWEQTAGGSQHGHLGKQASKGDNSFAYSGQQVPMTAASGHFDIGSNNKRVTQATGPMTRRGRNKKGSKKKVPWEDDTHAAEEQGTNAARTSVVTQAAFQQRMEDADYSNNARFAQLGDQIDKLSYQVSQLFDAPVRE